MEAASRLDVELRTNAFEFDIIQRGIGEIPRRALGIASSSVGSRKLWECWCSDSRQLLNRLWNRQHGPSFSDRA